MATSDGIAATSKAILGLLEKAWDLAQTPKPDFELFHASDFEGPAAKLPGGYGVSLYLYRVAINGTMRATPRQLKPDGQYYRAPLMLDLYYLLTAWAGDVEKQQQLLGWCMRILHDTSILPAALLRQPSPYAQTFGLDESVELIGEILSLQDLAVIWDKLKPKMQTSAAYVARLIRLESNQPLTQAGPVQTRNFALDGAPSETVRVREVR